MDTLPGDFTEDALPGEFDLILAANVLHMYDAGQARNLVQKAAQALLPGGRLIIHGFCTDPGDTSPLEDVLFSLNMGLLTENGRAHPLQEMRQWMAAAGFRDIRDFRIAAIPTGVVTGSLPG